MTVLMYPPPDVLPWPSLGAGVCQFIEANLVHGPGDLLGQPVTLNDEQRAWIYRMYEVEPPKVRVKRGPRSHWVKNPNAGKRRFERCVLSLRKGSSKALALDTPLPTPTGWTTMGAVQEGDWLFDAEGQPCRVTAVSEVFHGHQCFAVRFRDGNEIVADAGHRWYTEELRDRPYRGSVKTTADLASSVSVRADGARNHRIPVARPLQLPDADLPIDPWIFGMWLGDGRTDDSEFTVATADLPHFLGRVGAAGYHSGTPKPDKRSTANSVRVSATPIVRGTLQIRDTLKGRLRSLGVLGNKHVPLSFLRSSYAQRLQLLQGLMDSDGTIGAPGIGVSFVSTVAALADAVYELAASLGLKPTISPRKVSMKGAKRPVKQGWSVYFHAAASLPVFSLPRKRDRQTAAPVGRSAMSSNRHIVAVPEVESVPTKCLSVDSASHLFLAGRGMIPTHNTELAAWLTAAELHRDGPVRCAGFGTIRGMPLQPLPKGVEDPYIPLISYTEEQTEELAYGALRRILDDDGCSIGGDFDIGLQRILRKDGRGKAEAVAGSPNARDGARTTFMHADESHRFTLPALKQAWQVMMANLGKRPLADPWALETTTAPEPGAGSVGEATMDKAIKLLVDRPANEQRFFFYHREASDKHNLETDKGLRDAILEASGPYIAKWTDVERIARRFHDSDADRAYAERVWLNRRTQASSKAFDVARWKENLRPGYEVAKSAPITIGFDGSRYDDATGLVATEIATGFQWKLGVWQRPENAAAWEVDVAEVDGLVHDAFARFKVLRMYCDPPKWESWIASWAGEFGDKKVVEWWTNRRKPMAYALRAFDGAIRAGESSHDGDAELTSHIGNACKLDTKLKDDEEKPLWIIRKERPDSPHKIDLAMAAVLSWEARTDAIAAGEGVVPSYSLTFIGG